MNFFSTPSAQTQLAAAGGRAPANIKAKATDPILAQFGAASKGGVPMPNIPQMGSVWSDLGQAWVRSTKGAGAMPAARSFTGAARSIACQDRLDERRTTERAPSGARSARSPTPAT